MQEPSIRSFTLDYYRSQGAELKPLDPGARRWEILLPRMRQDDPALHVSFDPHSDDLRLKPMNRSTASWQEILESCLQARPVSYRHLVVEPHSGIVERFRLKLPHFPIKGAELVSVKLRKAIGFSHRVTYDAPAMASRKEELHHDLLDAEVGERLDDLSERFYSLPTIPIPPPKAASEIPIEALHARALALVDARTESRGLSNDLDLAQRLADAEERIHQYTADQKAKILETEELELTQRLEFLARRSQETRLIGAQAKIQTEADALNLEIDKLHDRRTIACLHLVAEERARLEAERERHETTVETTLVSIAYVTYDEVVYRLKLEHGDQVGYLDLSDVPVSDRLLIPPCPRCLQPFAVGHHAQSPGVEEALVICHRCAPKRPLSPPGRALEESCARCSIKTPAEAVQRCHLSETPYCVVCALTCNECGNVTQRELLRPNPSGRGMICPSHSFSCASCEHHVTMEETFSCTACSARHCLTHASPCSECGMPACPSCKEKFKRTCPACAMLAPAKATHDRIRLLLGLMPHLPRFGVRWQLAEINELCLIEYQHPLGQRGRIVLSTQDFGIQSQLQKGPFDRHWR